MAISASDRLRQICLALPEAVDMPMFRGPTYRVGVKIFAMERYDTGAIAVWCKAPEGSQAVLVGADPQRFFVPPYVGPKGWIGIRLDRDPDWAEVVVLIERSFRLIAPKKLVKQLAPRPDGRDPFGLLG